MSRPIVSTLSRPLVVIAILNEKLGVTVKTEDPERIITRLLKAYANNQLQYAERYSEAMQIVCRRYSVRVDQLNRAMARDSTVTKGVYAIIDRKFEKDIKKWIVKLE